MAKDRREGVWIHYSIYRTLGPIQQFLIPVLRNFLPSTETAREDLETAQKPEQASCCA